MAEVIAPIGISLDDGGASRTPLPRISVAIEGISEVF